MGGGHKIGHSRFTEFLSIVEARWNTLEGVQKLLQASVLVIKISKWRRPTALSGPTSISAHRQVRSVGSTSLCLFSDHGEQRPQKCCTLADSSQRSLSMLARILKDSRKNVGQQVFLEGGERTGFRFPIRVSRHGCVR
jgi:hypothetical protein